MNRSYLNSPSVGNAMSAEEFTAQSGMEPSFGPILDASGPQSQNGGDRQNGNGRGRPQNGGCGCQHNCGCGMENGFGPGPVIGGSFDDESQFGQGGRWDCGCCHPMMCCCKPVHYQPCEPIEVDEDGCCCKQSFRAALQLLCNPVLAALLDFSAVAFVTDDYLAGSVPQTPTVPESGTPADNLAETLTGTFRRFSPCDCDLLDINAPVYPTDVTSDVSVLTAAQMSLCALDALAIQAAEATAEGDLSEEEMAAFNFRRIQAILSARTTNSCVLTSEHHCQSCDEEGCCCSQGLLSALSQGNLSRQVSLVAGPLVLTNVTLLGTVGNVLVLANDNDYRIYFVCVNSVQFIG